jgi:hypothetical protein
VKVVESVAISVELRVKMQTNENAFRQETASWPLCGQRGVINSHQIAPVPRHRASLIYNALQKQHRGNRTMKAAGGVADSAFCDPRWGATALAGAVSRRTAEGWAAERYL